MLEKENNMLTKKEKWDMAGTIVLLAMVFMLFALDFYSKQNLPLVVFWLVAFVPSAWVVRWLFRKYRNSTFHILGGTLLLLLGVTGLARLAMAIF